MIIRDALTDRQYEVLGYVGRGYTVESLAHELNVTPATARTHVQHILTRLKARTRAQAAAMWAAEETERLMRQAYGLGDG